MNVHNFIMILSIMITAVCYVTGPCMFDTYWKWSNQSCPESSSRKRSTNPSTPVSSQTEHVVFDHVAGYAGSIFITGNYIFDLGLKTPFQIRHCLIFQRCWDKAWRLKPPISPHQNLWSPNPPTWKPTYTRSVGTSTFWKWVFQPCIPFIQKTRYKIYKIHLSFILDIAYNGWKCSVRLIS